MKNGKRDRLSGIFILWSAVFIILLCALLTLIGIGIYRRDMYSSYYDYAATLTRLSETHFDGDDIDRCIASGQMSPTLQEGLEEMNRIKENSDVAYMYALYYPEESNPTDMRYLLYANTQEDRDSGIPDSTIGAPCGDEYTEDIRQAFYTAQFSGNSKDQTGYVVNRYQGVGDAALVMTAYCPVFRSDGSVVCVIGSDIYMSLIYGSLKGYIARVAATGILLILLCMLGLHRITTRSIIRPVVSLAQSADDFVKQSEQTDDPRELEFHPVEVKGDTEIRDLSEDLTVMTDRLKDYMVHLQTVTKEKERIGAELALATRIQAHMLPSIFPAFPDRKEFDIYATMTPAKEVGGDFYDFFLIDDDHLALVMADVSGKGVPAALFMMMSKILVNNFAMMAGPEASPAEVLTHVNETICKNNEDEMFVTVWLGVLTISTGRVVAANAGHEYPILKTADGDFELMKDKHGFVIGGMEGMKYKEYEFTLENGGTLFLYTDGVAEATNADNELFGTERTLQALNRKKDADPEGILAGVRESVDAFVGEAPQFDDLTMLAVRRTAP